MIKRIYEIEGLDDVDVEHVDEMTDPSFLSEDMPSFLKPDQGKIHTI
jgi:hypothetical protein